MKVYFSGIGGVGIGPLAEIAHFAGYQVHGSDRHHSLITNNLSKLDIPYYIGEQDGTHLANVHKESPLDWFVYTAALPSDHPELQLANKLGIKTAKRDELLSKIIQDKQQKLIAIAGTHGKTSTTALAIWLFNQLNIPASYSVGSTISFGPSGFFNKESEYFLYECDEFDRNFLHFKPYLSVITNIGYDHQDTYPTVKSYQQAFEKFKKQSNQIVEWPKKGASNHSNALTVNQDITLPGAHNRQNASLLLAGLQKVGVINEANYKEAIKAINSFPGTSRRFEKLGPNLYTDYAHHPVEIAASLNTAHEIASQTARKIAVIYQPHQNSRQHAIKDQYDNQFAKAAVVFWLPTFLTREDTTLEVLTPKALTAKLKDKEKINFAQLDDELWQHVQKLLSSNYIVVGMGAGNIDAWLRQKAQPTQPQS